MGRSERRQRRVLRAEEDQGRNAFGWFVVLAVFGVGAMLAANDGEGWVFAVAVVIALFALVKLLQRSSRATHAKRVEKASRARGATRPARPSLPVPQARRAAVQPTVAVEFLKPAKFPRLPSRARRVKNSKNVIGRPVLDIVYLRMFANASRARTFLESAWREFGHVHLLRSADSVTKAEFKGKRRERFFVEDDDDFAEALRLVDRGAMRPGTHVVAGVAPKPIKLKDPFGCYPVCAIPCHVDYWRRAVDLLLQRADLIVLDLSGFTPQNVGTAYELQRVIDTVPVERVMLLCDPKSDVKFLRSTITAYWAQMGAGSPNTKGRQRQLRVGITDKFRTVAVRSGNQVGGYVELRSNRKDTRRLAAAASVNAEAAARH